MKTLNIDIETYSDVDIKLGVYRYTDTPNFQILLFAYSIDGSDVQIIDLTQDKLPVEIQEALVDPNVLKIAYNAQFERVCLSRYLGKWFLDPAQWRCTMVHASELSLPASLSKCASYLKVDEQKDAAGTQLINYFSKPCKPTKANGSRTRNLPEHAPDKWEAFKSYCVQDVRTEMAIAEKLEKLPIIDREWQLYALDQTMNDRGVGVDIELVDGAVVIDESLSKLGLARLKKITQLDNPNSLSQFKAWLMSKGYVFETLSKETVKTVLKEGIDDKDVAKALELRLSLSNSSTKKYVMLQNATCSDSRIHGILQFYGASRTGRWAGRLLQVQNLPRNYMTLLDEARELVKRQDTESLDMIFSDVSDVLKQLIRTTLVARERHTFIVSDFSAIEARVIAWYAGEEWVLDAFRTHGKIYEATAAQMFHLGDVLEYDWKSADGKAMRQRGKVATLALGYQGGVNALKAMGALNMGVSEDELPDLVDAWRKANKKIVQFWRNTQDAVIQVMSNGGVVRGPKGLKFYRKHGFLLIQLPSGRTLAYPKARLVDGDYGPKITYEGQGTKVFFETQDTYGGKLVENIVQATARDLLAEAMLRLDSMFLPIAFHVHDEVVLEVPKDIYTVEEVNDIMSQVPDWAEGLPLSAEGYETDYYKKD